MRILPTLLFYILTSTTGLLLLRRTLSEVVAFDVSSLRGLVTNPLFIGGVLSYIISFLTWLYLLSQRDVTTIYPIALGLGYTAVVISSLIFLQERISAIQLVGIILIGLGLLLIIR